MTLASFAEAHRLRTGKKCCHGIWNGYRVHVKYAAFGNPPCILTVVTDTGDREQVIRKFIQHAKKELRVSESGFGVVGIGIMLAPKLGGADFRAVERILDRITAFLAKNGFPGADRCPYCGEELGSRNVTAMSDSGIPFVAHEPCFEKAFLDQEEKEKQEAARPDRKFEGVLGALLGGVIAAAFFFLFYEWFGFGPIGILIGVPLGGWMYSKFGGKETVFKIAACLLSALVLSAAGYWLGLYATVSGGISAYLATDAGQTDLILQCVFTVVALALAAGWLVFLRARKKKKRAVVVRLKGV